MEHLESAKLAKRDATNNVIPDRSPKITIVGTGNLLLKDEGVGIHIIQRLEGRPECSDITLIDGGTDPDTLYLLDDDIDKLIIIDAAAAGGEPGAMYRFTADEIDPGNEPLSLHELGIANGLKMLEFLNKKPKSITIIGIEPKEIDFGLELSPEIESNIPTYIEFIMQEINETNKCMEVIR